MPPHDAMTFDRQQNLEHTKKKNTRTSANCFAGWEMQKTQRLNKNKTRISNWHCLLSLIFNKKKGNLPGQLPLALHEK
jgi:hypothetical protein